MLVTSNGSAQATSSVSSSASFSWLSRRSSPVVDARTTSYGCVGSEIGARQVARPSRETLNAATSRSPPTTTSGSASPSAMNREHLDPPVARHQAEQAAPVGHPARRLRRERVARIGERGVAQLVVKVARDRARVATRRQARRSSSVPRAVGPAALVAEIGHLLSVGRKDGRRWPGRDGASAAWRGRRCWARPRRR